jgi:hypothetical protein
MCRNHGHKIKTTHLLLLNNLQLQGSIQWSGRKKKAAARRINGVFEAVASGLDPGIAWSLVVGKDKPEKIQPNEGARNGKGKREKLTQSGCSHRKKKVRSEVKRRVSLAVGEKSTDAKQANRDK